jgi:hypothetical protein
MKRLILAAAALAVPLVGSVAHADTIGFGTNEIFFRTFANLYDSSGTLKPILPTASGGTNIAVGDYIVGILQVQNIDIAGTTIFSSTPTHQLTGLVVQRVTSISTGTTFVGEQNPLLPHIAFGAPLITSFSGPGGTISTAGLLTGSEMLALFEDNRGVSTTAFETNGTIPDDFTKATDGTKVLGFGYSQGGDGSSDPATAANDDGYFYANAATTLVTDPPVNAFGNIFGALNADFNTTGINILRISNDPNEAAVGNNTPGGIKLNDVFLRSSITLNTPNFTNGVSPWAILTNDPAQLTTPVPTPAVASAGAGLFGLLAFRRRARKTA